MIVTVTDIVAKIKDLPPDYADHVHLSKPGTAEVTSFTDPTQEIPYSVGIKLAEKKGERDVRCTCPATRLCKHITAFYAVAKGYKPDGSVKKPNKTTTPKVEPKQTPNEHAKRVLAEIDNSITALNSAELAFNKLAVAAKQAKECWERMKVEKK